MIEKIVSTYTATIYVGLKHRPTGEIIDKSVALREIQAYCDKVGLCVTVADTQYVYVNGCEPGIAVGLINYPRFPSTSKQIYDHAIKLAEILKSACKQFKVSVVTPSTTCMIADPE